MFAKFSPSRYGTLVYINANTAEQIYAFLERAFNIAQFKDRRHERSNQRGTYVTPINRKDVFSVQLYNKLMLLLIILGFGK
jgi:hypothetical protein